ncbi:PDZ domain-containing protein [Leucobacter sp. OH2974_COT-288]|nr:PDZ domain-containing protein [Leucobacter sp. OH2974_COT-288]
MAEHRTLTANDSEQTPAAPTVCSRMRAPKTRGPKPLYTAVATLGVLLGVAAASLPSPYLVERPGMVLNTLGELEIEPGQATAVVQPEAEIASAAPNSGVLNMLTVSISGNKDRPRSWGSLIGPFFDESQDIIPVSEIYPEDRSVDDVNAESAQLMQSSQNVAAAAALRYLGHPVENRVFVAGTVPDTAAAAQLQEGDEILTVNGAVVTDGQDLVDAVQQVGDNTITLEILRGSEKMSLALATTWSADAERFILGVYPRVEFGLPYTIDYAMTDIGGPSAGLVLALAIIDKMQEEDLTGGVQVSVTGTMNGRGEVGAIGGLKQKLYAAERAGTELFLMPADNCSALPERIPGEMEVVAVADLAAAVQTIRDYKAGKPTVGLTACD